MTSIVRVQGQTGVEMEAIAAVMMTALTVYDMCKAIDKSIELGPFYLLEKTGGKSGIFKRKVTRESRASKRLSPNKGDNERQGNLGKHQRRERRKEA